MKKLRRAGTLRLGVAALLVVPGAAVAQAAAGGGAVTKVRAPLREDTIRVRTDSVARVRVEQSRRIMRQIDSLLDVQSTVAISSPRFLELEAEIARAKQALSPTFAITRPTMIRDVRPPGGVVLSPELQIAFRNNDAEAERMLESAMPKGRLGFTAYGPVTQTLTPNSMTMQYFVYPEIVVIEPNSPAHRAGIQRGDSLIAYNGNDVRGRVFNFTQLLTPGRTVDVRTRQGGVVKDYSLVVDAASPDEVQRRITNLIVGERAARASAVASAMGVGTGRMERVELRPSVVAGAPPSATSTTYLISVAGILGASMQALDADLAKSIIGMKGSTGVFINRVGENSPAYRLGLRSGDVILRLDAIDIVTVSQLQRLLQERRAAQQKSKLTILRAGKTEQISVDSP